MRRSSIVLLIAGALLIVVAAVIRFIAVPELSKLPGDTNATAGFEGNLRQLDPATFALDSGTPITIDRAVTVDQVAGDTAVITSKAVSHLPAGDSTDMHTYAISRVDYTQADAPDGAEVEDQRGGVTLSFPVEPTTDDALVYDSVTRTAQPVKYTETSTLAGREVYEFSGTTTAEIADPAVLEPVKAGIAALAQGGDGSTLPKAVLEMLLPALPAERIAAAREALASAPNDVPLAYTSTNTFDLAVDTQFGSPIRNAQDQTTVLNIQSANSTVVPVLDLSNVQAATSEATIQTTAQGLQDGARQLGIFAVWVPLGALILGLLLIGLGLLRRRPRQERGEVSVG